MWSEDSLQGLILSFRQGVPGIKLRSSALTASTLYLCKCASVQGHPNLSPSSPELGLQMVVSYLISVQGIELQSSDTCF